MKDIKFYLPGVFLILLAIMIFAFPEILVALVAALVILFGIGSLYVGHLIRKSRSEVKKDNPYPIDG